ncbi:lipocalin family protein [Winogradskyella forsetii]|uniref:lipocalin family protein n=1 Tax=Winogradskyella forsetii TaxID=2686077 RepID=UPI0015B931DF|nr:lipocalin family protein [Winogradskyella forsetii]
MKKLNLLFLLLFVSIVVSSCSSDDSDSNPDVSAEAILGTWVGVDIDYSGTTTTTYLGQSIVSEFVSDAYDVDYTITFGENPQTFVSEGSYSVEITSTTLGQTTVHNEENLEFLQDGTWSLNGNQLTVTVPNGEPQIATISILPNGLIELNSSVDDIINQDGIESHVVVNSITTYERL